MIYLVVLLALYALHLLLKLHWITTVVIGGFLLLRISGHRKWYKKKIVYERKFEEVSEYLDMLLYAFVKEEKVERALVNEMRRWWMVRCAEFSKKPLIICI